ncbi:Mu transposase C-terminal domain-containing protein [Methylomonas sp. 2BW1-5-20]|uniref:Mu transposase C-terminal domain-containing protein n=1 Tax=Methylomonas sp. 2BW1-5-20 TaxID=3376686 RepID=UPI0040506D90
MTTEHFYTAKQLAGLPDMPGTERGVNKAAARDNWPHRQREGRGGGREYAASALPKATQKALQAQREQDTAKAVLQPAAIQLPAITLKEYDIRDWQRTQRDARDGVCQAITRLMENGISMEKAYKLLLGQSLAAGPDSHEYKMLERAKDARGLKRAVGDIDFPSLRSIQRWMEAGDLTPKARKKDTAIPAWAGDFLACYQQPQKPSVEEAYGELCKHYGNRDKPSVHQVRRFLSKLPAIVREKGRMGSREIKNIKPFVRRTFEELWPNDVWSADGHTFDAEVQHPLHGRPFRPEITSIIDIGTRKIVGFSVGLAESALSTVDALRHAITTHGDLAIFYVDNGSGFDNEMLTDEGVGLLSRFGATVKHSLPYNSQARGVVERLHRSVWVPAAKTLPSYIGADMDREAKQLNYKLTRTGDKDGVVRMPISWQNFIKLCEDAIEAYNQRSHSGLPKFVDENGKRRHYSPAEYWRHRVESIEGFNADIVKPEVAEMLFKPRIKRTVARGEVQLFNNKYFSQELAMYHGEELQVAYDIHDPDFVWLYNAEGQFICKAEWGGNEKAYFAQPVIELARENRSTGRLKRAEAHMEEIIAERDTRPALEAIPVNELPGMEIIAKKIEEKVSTRMAVTIPEDPRERHLFWREWTQKSANGTAIPDELQMFMSSYPTTAKYKSWEAYYNAGRDSATG